MLRLIGYSSGATVDRLTEDLRTVQPSLSLPRHDTVDMCNLLMQRLRVAGTKHAAFGDSCNYPRPES
jgi:hypothetical protein